MFRLRTGYFATGIATGLILLFSFLWSLPDGKLHIVFCDVGQGDAAYIRFPDGRDMLVDGGPNDKVLGCLGRHMPFWDRRINMVLMTHPQKDHMQGLIAVLSRYGTDYFVRSDITNTTEGYRELKSDISDKHVRVRYVTTGETIRVGATTLSVLWPSDEQIARMKPQRSDLVSGQGRTLSEPVLGASAPSDLNDGSIVFWLNYGSFDAVFTGDADTRVENGWRDEMALRLADTRSGQALGVLEVLKVPHHGSKTAMTEAFLETLQPKLAVISVGKNSYGHPSTKLVEVLKTIGSDIKRTDQEGDIKIISDGKGWNVSSGGKK